MNNNSFSTINTQSSNADALMFKRYHFGFGFKRANKNETKIWIYTHKSCNASITID